MLRRFARALACVSVVSFCQTPALALDKQGSAHGGQVGGGSHEFNVSGAGLLGAALYNPSYAARPDNSGLSLFRYALHVDVDLLGRLLSIPLDLNLLTDRTRPGVAVLAPSELDVIAGLTTTGELSRGFDLELGARVENDRPVDRRGLQQAYVDVRSRLLYSAAALSPGLARALRDGDVQGYATLGWFAINPSYAARPDNSGRALLRYEGHGELSVWHHHLALGADGTFFSDRRASSVLAPSELDVTGEAIGRAGAFELHLAYERDMPIDRRGLVQSLLYVTGAYSFDFHEQLHPQKTAPGR